MGSKSRRFASQQTAEMILLEFRYMDNSQKNHNEPPKMKKKKERKGKKEKNSRAVEVAKGN